MALYAPTQLKPAGTRSYRLASSQLFDLGINSQNYDKESADIYEAPPGHSFYQRDQAGAEALVVAYEAKPGRYRALFENKLKPHTYVALHLFLDKFRKAHPRERYWLKSAPELKALPEWAELCNYIQKKSKFEYDIGKRTGHACCDDKTTVLTPSGWVPVGNKPSVILTSTANGVAQWETVIWHEYDYNGLLLNFVGEEVDQCVTPNHRMLYETNGNRKVKTALELSLDVPGTRKLIVAGEVDQSPTIDPRLLRLAVAVQADGSYANDKIRFHFKKLRKVERLEKLCSAINVELTWQVGIDDDYRCTVPRTGLFEQACNLLSSDKRFTTAFYKLNKTEAAIVVDECTHWDGHVDLGERNYKSYFSMVRSNVDLIYTLARMCGIGSTMRYSSGLWTVSFNRRQCSYAKDLIHVPYNGKVYCPTTKAGFFYSRRNLKISITGNSNYKMGPNTFRESALKESEGSLVMSFEEAAYYLNIYKELFPEIVEWQIEIEHAIKTERILRNLFGFPRRFERQITDSYIREAISWIPQSTVGCITHRAYRKTYDYIEGNRLPWRLVSNKHDSYAVLAPDSDQEFVRDIMAEHIGQHLVGKRGEFTMISDFQVGKNLKKYDPDTNPLGMREV